MTWGKVVGLADLLARPAEEVGLGSRHQVAKLGLGPGATAMKAGRQATEAVRGAGDVAVLAEAEVRDEGGAIEPLLGVVDEEVKHGPGRRVIDRLVEGDGKVQVSGAEVFHGSSVRAVPPEGRGTGPRVAVLVG